MARILERDGGCCVWCSVPLAAGDRRLTFEHVVERALLALRDAIAERGGQRRARPYLERELRRLGLS